MTIAITSKEEKSETVDLLRRLITRFIFPGLLNLSEREAILGHMEWIKRQPGMFVDTRFETISELQATKITFTISHTPQGPVKHHG